MFSEWMAVLKLPLTREQFHQLPRNPSYKYEYLNGTAWLSPRPRCYHAVLDLDAETGARLGGADDSRVLRPLRPGDWDDLAGVFAGAFRAVPPFDGLEDGPRREAARSCLEHTRAGRDGPLVERASFVAARPGDDRPQGFILITLLPNGDLSEWDSYRWREPPPADCVERRLGQPHLTWIAVSSWHAGQGLGTSLLWAAVRALLALGYTRLASTFLLGNHLSMLWHWRNGFRLLSYPGSPRLWNGGTDAPGA